MQMPVQKKEMLEKRVDPNSFTTELVHNLNRLEKKEIEIRKEAQRNSPITKAFNNSSLSFIPIK